MSNCTAQVLNRWAHRIRQSIPAHCVLCGAATRAQRLCEPCTRALPRVPQNRCVVCALPLPSGSLCGDCLDRPPAYDSVTAVYCYAFPVDALVRAYKYRGDLTLAPLFGHHLAREAGAQVDAIVPMPLAAARLRERGFNQAYELGRYVGRALGLPVLASACRKVADTPPQAALPWSERASNVRGAFVCDIDLSGKRIAVVDDVMTTGATLNELAKNLKRAGAASVSGWMIARTLR